MPEGQIPLSLALSVWKCLESQVGVRQDLHRRCLWSSYQRKAERSDADSVKLKLVGAHASHVQLHSSTA